jgi:hypothetical protein
MPPLITGQQAYRIQEASHHVQLFVCFSFGIGHFKPLLQEKVLSNQSCLVPVLTTLVTTN